MCSKQVSLPFDDTWVICNFVCTIPLENDIVVSAPTGSGKTVVFEMAIVELLMRLEQANCDTCNVKIVYGTLDCLCIFPKIYHL